MLQPGKCSREAGTTYRQDPGVGVTHSLCSSKAKADISPPGRISEFDEVYRDAAAARDYGDAIQDGLKALIELDRPTIAILQGNAVGGGLGLALGCDLRFCAADAYLAVTPAKLGLVY